MKKFFLGFISATLLIVTIQSALAAIDPNLSSKTFSDIKENDWYTGSLTHLSFLEVIEGYPDGTFKPSNNVNRAEVTVMMDRLAKRVATNFQELRFVTCYSSAVEPDSQLSDEEKQKYRELREKICAQANGQWLSGSLL